MLGALRASRGHHHLNLQEPYYLSMSTQQVTQTPRLSPAPSQVAGVRSSKRPHRGNTALVSQRGGLKAPRGCVQTMAVEGGRSSSLHSSEANREGVQARNGQDTAVPATRELRNCRPARQAARGEAPARRHL